jgi:hypothetical protein
MPQTTSPTQACNHRLIVLPCVLLLLCRDAAGLGQLLVQRGVVFGAGEAVRVDVLGFGGCNCPRLQRS